MGVRLKNQNVFSTQGVDFTASSSGLNIPGGYNLTLANTEALIRFLATKFKVTDPVPDFSSDS